MAHKLNKIFILVKSSGSYSDYSSENMCAFFDQEEAECERLTYEELYERYAQAKRLMYENQTQWCKNNPHPDYNMAAHLEDELSRLRKNKNRTAKQKERYKELEELRQVQRNAVMEWSAYLKEEDKRFINSLAFLTNEQKNNLISGITMFETDASFSVQELDLKDSCNFYTVLYRGSKIE